MLVEGGDDGDQTAEMNRSERSEARKDENEDELIRASSMRLRLTCD